MYDIFRTSPAEFDVVKVSRASSKDSGSNDDEVGKVVAILLLFSDDDVPIDDPSRDGGGSDAILPGYIVSLI